MNFKIMPNGENFDITIEAGKCDLARMMMELGALSWNDVMRKWDKLNNYLIVMEARKTQEEHWHRFWVELKEHLDNAGIKEVNIIPTQQ